MDELGATSGVVAELPAGKWEDASAQPVAGLQDRHPRAGACQIAASHQTGSTRTDDQDTRMMARHRCGLYVCGGAERLAGAPLASARPPGVSQRLLLYQNSARR